MKHLLFSLLILISFSSWAQISSKDFEQKTKEHKERVVQLGLSVFEEFSIFFSGLEKDVIKKFLLIHDQPKIQNIFELKKYGYSSHLSILEQLSLYYGKNKKDLDSYNQFRLQSIINELNRIEKVQKNEFFVKYNINQQYQSALIWVESIIDITDTGIARRNELGIVNPIKYNGAQFFIDVKKDSLASQISIWLEDHYYTILVKQKFCNKTFVL